MIDPHLLRLFVIVYESGSFAGGALRLDLDRSRVSRAIAQLEQQIGARLFHRTTRRLALTDEGAEVLARARTIDTAMRNIEQWRDDRDGEPGGRLRVSCPMAVGRTLLVPALGGFRQRYPRVTVQLEFDDRLLDLAGARFDLAFRVTRSPPEGMVAVHLADNPRALVASPAYLARRGTPQTPADLRQHDCLVYGRNDLELCDWPFAPGPAATNVPADGAAAPLVVRVTPSLLVNDGRCLVELAAAGHGVLLIDRLLIHDELQTGQLVSLCPDHPPVSGLPLYAVYPSRQWLPRRARVFIDYFREVLADLQGSR